MRTFDPFRLAARMLGFVLTFIVATATAAAAQTAPLPPGDALAVQAGAFNVGREPIHAYGGLELRVDRGAWVLDAGRLRITPTLGIGGSTGSAGYGYLGARSDLALPRGWRITAGFGFALYGERRNADLGGPFAFRSAFELAYRLPHGQVLGATFFHMSNARLYHDNPGTNVLALVFEVPLGRRGR